MCQLENMVICNETCEWDTVLYFQNVYNGDSWPAVRSNCWSYWLSYCACVTRPHHKRTGLKYIVRFNIIVANDFKNFTVNFIKSDASLILFNLDWTVFCTCRERQYRMGSTLPRWHKVNFFYFCNNFGKCGLIGRPLGRLWYPMSSVVCLSVTFCIVAKRHILAKNCLKEQIG